MKALEDRTYTMPEVLELMDEAMDNVELAYGMSIGVLINLPDPKQAIREFMLSRMQEVKERRQKRELAQMPPAGEA